MSILYAAGITILSAELIFILARSADILIALKSEEQRTSVERQRMKRGLLRSIVFEGLLFVAYRNPDRVGRTRKQILLYAWLRNSESDCNRLGSDPGG